MWFKTDVKYSTFMCGGNKKASENGFSPMQNIDLYRHIYNINPHGIHKLVNSWWVIHNVNVKTHLHTSTLADDKTSKDIKGIWEWHSLPLFVQRLMTEWSAWCKQLYLWPKVHGDTCSSISTFWLLKVWILSNMFSGKIGLTKITTIFFRSDCREGW